ncbi:uncharacterized protein [Diadema setosum]|uniref:uncharacterized protein n=1 Tax=Diadema setosum TaxID=31175 RepID=UPI003B3B5D05
MLLDRSQLQRIEAGTFHNVPLLQTLDLSGNKFVSPPCDAFSPYNVLTEFYLNGNLISNIPENCFEMLANVQRITLNDNPLEDIIESAFAGLTSLKTIELENTSLSAVPVGALSSVRKVTHLKMAGNLIAALNERDFSVLPKIEFIDLSHNRLRFIHEYAFSRMHHLKVLILSNNEIAHIGWRAFIPVENTLQELHLHGNQLTSISNISASTILSLQTFLVADNPLRCHCHLFEYRYFLQNRPDVQQKLGGHGKCIGPESEIEVSVLESSLTEVACPSVGTSARPHDSDRQYAQVPTTTSVPFATLTSEATEGVSSSMDQTFVALTSLVSITGFVLVILLTILGCCKVLKNRRNQANPDTHLENNDCITVKTQKI